MDDPIGANLHRRTHPLPDLSGRSPKTRKPEPEEPQPAGTVAAAFLAAALCYARLRLLLSAVRRRKVTARLKVSPTG
jgi:hypothetical protein